MITDFINQGPGPILSSKEVKKFIRSIPRVKKSRGFRKIAKGLNADEKRQIITIAERVVEVDGIVSKAEARFLKALRHGFDVTEQRMDPFANGVVSRA